MPEEPGADESGSGDRLARDLQLPRQASRLQRDVGLSAVAGALTPGGPVVGFAIAAAALKAGAGTEPVIAYVIGWSLYGLTRMLAWELPIMPRNVYIVRILVASPLPFLAAALAMLAQ